MIVNFTVPGKPQGKARVRAARIGNYIRTYTPAETVNYENYIKVCFKAAYPQFYSQQPLIMSVTAYYPIPSSWSFKKAAKAAAGEIRPCIKPDCDNVLKLTADALNCVAYNDDKNIVEANIKKLYGENPRLEIQLTEI